uniref:Replication factor A C-terminal domain-containing protein n=3 Tax=Octopus bimaculoides TaxID=37653 RepID=A0A0L8GYH2_OCTBM|eukprot:XP_014777004.1 PREDICTED: uncharacterized protein LOC106873971 [Octopus bimaculoides]
MTNESDDTSSEILTDSQSNFEDYVKVAPKILFSVVSVIQGHQSVEFAHICDIINTPAPMKFRLLTRVWDYCPKLTSVSDFLSLFCPECNYTTPINNYKLEPSTFHIKDGVEYYRCPYCASKNISDDVPLMEYIFLLRFVLTDGHYFLIANLWRDEAVKFFRQITPLEFISDANVVNKVRSCLARIHSRRMKNKNKTLIECCIKSFHGHRSAVCYEMFDTFLS